MRKVVDPMVPVVNPLQAALGTLVTELGNVAVVFGAFGANQATVIETAVVGVIGVAYLLANALHHNANAKITAGR